MIKCKRIIDGKTYNTETATLIFDGFNSHDPENGTNLYQTRFGAFFLYLYSVGENEYGTWGEFEDLRSITPSEAQAWLEKNAADRPGLIESLFGEMPEAGQGEIKFTLRMPESLKNRLTVKAEENKQSLNAWIIRCLERCAEHLK